MTRVGTALAAAVALLSVSACTGEEPAGGDPTTSAPSPRATSSPTPTPAAPTIPPEATEHSADGAAAFVEYYIAVFNHAATTGDTTALAAASTKNCQTCTGLIDRYIRIYADGGSSENPGWRPTITSSQLARGQFYVTVDLQTASHVYRPRKGSAVQHVKATTYHDIYRLKWSSGRWLVDRLAPQEVPE